MIAPSAGTAMTFAPCLFNAKESDLQEFTFIAPSTNCPNLRKQRTFPLTLPPRLWYPFIELI